LFRTLGWVYSAWVVALSSDDDQGELDLIMPTDEDYLMTADEDYNLTNDDDQDFDQLGVGVHRQVENENVFEDGWYHDWDSWWDDWTEMIEEYLLDELPHRAGLLVRPFADFAVRLPVWGVLEGVSLAVLACKLEYQRVWHAFLARPGWLTAPAVAAVWAVRFVAWAALFAWLVAQLDYAAFRVEITCTVGVTWREEYYLAWVVFCFLSSVYLAGPLTWKDFFFQRVGLNYLAGLFLGVTEAAAPDEYYPSRHPGPVSRWLDNNVANAPTRDDFYEAVEGVDLVSEAQRIGVGYDDTRVILLRQYGYDESPYDELNDLEVLGFVFPFHRGTRAEPTLYTARPSGNSHVRAARDTSGFRTERYSLEFPPTNTTAPFLPGYPVGLTPNERSNRLNREDYSND
jgi:hypothetical protein